MKQNLCFVALFALSAVPLLAQEFDDLLSDTINQLGTQTQEIWDEFPWGSGYNESATFATTGCSIDINNNGQTNPPPMLLHPGTNRFLHPLTSDGIVRLGTNQRVELLCSVAFAAPFNGIAPLQSGICLGNNLFQLNGRTVQLNTVRCSAHARHVDQRTSGRTCASGSATLVELGFHVTGAQPPRFLRLMDVCHDERAHSTLYTHFQLTPASMGFQRNFPRPGFIKGTFFGPLNVNNLYTGATQRQTIGRIIGPRRVEQLFDNSRNFFLARGHLAAKTDYIYGTEQRGTFFFVNAAPQWQSFNAGNWERIEFGVKSFVAAQKMSAQVYTGTFGVLRLADEAGVERELFLNFDANGRGQIPVPLFFYKVVIDERTGRGIVFVGVNNPHVTQADVARGRYTLCRDVGYRVSYVNWQRANLARGYSYACDVNEWARVVGHLPASVRATGLLV